MLCLLCLQHLVSVVDKEYGIPPWASLGTVFTLSLALPFLLVFFIAGPEQPTPPSGTAPADAHSSEKKPSAGAAPASKKGTDAKAAKESKKTN